MRSREVVVNAFQTRSSEALRLAKCLSGGHPDMRSSATFSAISACSNANRVASRFHSECSERGGCTPERHRDRILRCIEDRGRVAAAERVAATTAIRRTAPFSETG